MQLSLMFFVVWVGLSSGREALETVCRDQKECEDQPCFIREECLSDEERKQTVLVNLRSFTLDSNEIAMARNLIAKIFMDLHGGRLSPTEADSTKSIMTTEGTSSSNAMTATESESSKTKIVTETANSATEVASTTASEQEITESITEPTTGSPSPLSDSPMDSELRDGTNSGAPEYGTSTESASSATGSIPFEKSPVSAAFADGGLSKQGRRAESVGESELESAREAPREEKMLTRGRSRRAFLLSRRASESAPGRTQGSTKQTVESGDITESQTEVSLTTGGGYSEHKVSSAMISRLTSTEKVTDSSAIEMTSSSTTRPTPRSKIFFIIEAQKVCDEAGASLWGQNIEGVELRTALRFVAFQEDGDQGFSIMERARLQLSEMNRRLKAEAAKQIPAVYIEIHEDINVSNTPLLIAAGVCIAVVVTLAVGTFLCRIQRRTGTAQRTRGRDPEAYELSASRRSRDVERVSGR